MDMQNGVLQQPQGEGDGNGIGIGAGVREGGRGKALSAEDDAKLVFGTVFSLRGMVRKLGGVDDKYALLLLFPLEGRG